MRIEPDKGATTRALLRVKIWNRVWHQVPELVWEQAWEQLWLPMWIQIYRQESARVLDQVVESLETQSHKTQETQDKK